LAGGGIDGLRHGHASASHFNTAAAPHLNFHTHRHGYAASNRYALASAPACRPLRRLGR